MSLTLVEKEEVLEVEKSDALAQRPGDEQWGHTVSEAIQAERTERAMTVMQAIRLYPKAMGWSLVMSLCIVMEGYDTSLLSSIIGLPAFRQKYGHYSGHPSTGYQLTPAWQTAIGQASTIGNFIGIFISSWSQERFGYRRTTQVCLVLIASFIFVVFFAPSVHLLFVGELLCGFPWGAFSAAAVAYASEVTPVALRGYLTTYVNLCWIMGQMISAGVLEGVSARTDQWAYKIPFAIQWIWPVPLFVLVTLAPESPWFLVRKGRLLEAEKALSRLSRKSDEISTEQTVAMMVRTNQHEIDNRTGTSYWYCFQGSNLRRTEIACVTWAMTVLVGSPFANHPIYFFEQAGVSTANAFKVNLGMRGLAFLGTVLSWYSMTYSGRRPILLGGILTVSICLLLVGIISFRGDTHPAAAWGEVAMIMVWVFVWDFAINPVAYAVVGEVSSTRLRGKSVGLARNLYNVSAVVGGILNTYQLNPTAWNWKGRTGFFWFGSSVLTLVWAYFRLPETKGRTFRELNILFEKRVSARKFKETQVSETDEQ